MLGTRKHEPWSLPPTSVSLQVRVALGGTQFPGPMYARTPGPRKAVIQRDASVGSWRLGQNTLKKSRPRGYIYIHGAPTVVGYNLRWFLEI